MKPILPLFIMIDACGWEIIKTRPQFLAQAAPHRRRLTSVFGYSSTCVPSILSGRWPDEHRNWCYFVYDPKNSPFRSLRWLRWLPPAVTSRRIFRRWLTKFVKRAAQVPGYFDLYNIPFPLHPPLRLHREEEPAPAQRHESGAEHLRPPRSRSSIPYFVTEPPESRRQNRDRLNRRHRTSERIDFAFHVLGRPRRPAASRRQQVPRGAREAAASMSSGSADVLAAARQHYREVTPARLQRPRHGELRRAARPQGPDRPAPLRMGKDYAVVYDSTMARFWFFNDQAREAVIAALEAGAQGRIMPDAELRSSCAISRTASAS
jgi:hypothetical protein